MIKNFVLIMGMLIPAIAFPRIHSEGVSLKTDFLALMNGMIENGIRSGSVSGEIYFNDQFSFSLDAELARQRWTAVERIRRSYGGHFRWYFVQDDCSCSAFFIGAYFTLNETRQQVDPQRLKSIAVAYRHSSPEAGLCGGYQALLARHFVIDPGLRLGMELNPRKKNNAGVEYGSRNPAEVLVHIYLGIGYRF